jgi:hypothetical protein
MAPALGLPTSRVYEIIGGRRKVQIEELPAMAAYLEMEEQELLSSLLGEMDPVAKDAEQNNALSAARLNGESARISTLGERVRDERTARQWSQAELARRVSEILGRTITQVAIHHIENRGNVMPRFSVELARALNVFARLVAFRRGTERATSAHGRSARQ